MVYVERVLQVKTRMAMLRVMIKETCYTLIRLYKMIDFLKCFGQQRRGKKWKGRQRRNHDNHIGKSESHSVTSWNWSNILLPNYLSQVLCVEYAFVGDHAIACLP